MNMTPVLEVDDLTVSYETAYGPLAAVRSVALSIPRGAALGLVGESGSGKSTVAAAILDLMGPGARVDGGSIFFEGDDLDKMPKQKRRALLGDRIGTVFQDPFTSLNPSLRVGLQIAEPLIEHRGMRRDQALDRARELLAEMGISRTRDVARAYPHQLSGGMKQRALIAAALACEPSLMILDEPTTALDVTIEAQILDLLHDLRARRQLSLLFISHNLAVVYRLCDSVCVLYAGQVMEQGPTADLFRRPRHPYTKGLFASLPRLNERGRHRRLAPIPGSLPSLVSLPVGCVFHTRCPFVEDRCREEVQVLANGSGERMARCWKAGSVAELSWPTAASHAGRTPDPNDRNALVDVQDLTKEFRLGGFWDSFRLRRRGESGLPVVREVRRLRAVDRVELTIAPGEVLGLVGESGCGKSTLGRCLIRLIDPSAGVTYFDGMEITAMRGAALQPFRRQAQIIFQNPDSSLNPRMTVGDIVARPLRLFGMVQARGVARRVEELLDLVRLSPEYIGRYPHQLSGGEKQRVGIARALASEPRFIVCDEAVSALDVSVQAAIINLLADLRDELDLALLFISHDLSVVSHLADRIAVMYQGAICEIGPTDVILHPPYHPYTQALLSAIPRITAKEDAQDRIRLPGEVAEHVETGPECRFHRRCPMKIDGVCDAVEPPTIALSDDHRIICHHRPERLASLHSILPQARADSRAADNRGD